MNLKIVDSTYKISWILTFSSKNQRVSLSYMFFVIKCEMSPPPPPPNECFVVETSAFSTAFVFNSCLLIQAKFTNQKGQLLNEPFQVVLFINFVDSYWKNVLVKCTLNTYKDILFRTNTAVLTIYLSPGSTFR